MSIEKRKIIFNIVEQTNKHDTRINFFNPYISYKSYYYKYKKRIFSPCAGVNNSIINLKF